MKLLLTGATGKVGQAFLPAFLACERFSGAKVVALCNNRMVKQSARVEPLRGSLADPEAVSAALTGVTHVVHLAAVKESPDLVIDVAIKGLFTLLEAFRVSDTARQFVLMSGDCAVGHMFHEYDGPITETSPRRAYQGCYALTKVMEEVMLEQYQIQYDLNGCILRAPWIMDKDDFRFAMAFGPEQFGGPPWRDLLDEKECARLAGGGHVPDMRDVNGRALLRNFVHVDDVARALIAALDAPAARQQLFNISMNEPVSYADAARRISAAHGQEPTEISTPYYSNWLDNSKARMLLDWAPEVDLEAMIRRAWSYKRAANDPRTTWYPG